MAKRPSKKKNIPSRQDNIVERLEELCISIFAHCENDYEVTLAGNGTNSSEAANVAAAILDILHGDSRKWEKDKDNEERIKKYAAELRKLYGDE